MFAFVFESVGSGEWLVLLAVILIVVGPRNLPAAARKMGQVMSKLRRAADEFKRQLMTMDEEMKKTADEIKHDYIDIPEDNAGDRAVEESAEADDSHDEGHDDYSDYPDGYEDYYGMTDENGLEVPSQDGEPESPGESAAAEPAAPSAEGEGGQSANPDPQPSTLNANGQDKGNTQGS
jgi:sec-independent protein translocase protein TatB